MKSIIFIAMGVCILCFGSMAQVDAAEVQIPPGVMTATAKATEGPARTPDHVVDGSGMTGLAHSNGHADNQMWHSPNTTNRWFRVDLGSSYDLGNMVIYNLNWAGLTGRGCKNVEVFYSNSGTDPGNPRDNPGNWTAFGSAFDLTQAPGASDYGTTNAVTPDVVDLTGTTARWVSLKINSVYASGYGGLSEILFYSVITAESDAPTPNPATFASGPAALSDTVVKMTATIGSDATGPVEYLFTNTTLATDSGWVTSPVHIDTGLDSGTQYTYTVQMRDSSSTPNVGTASDPNDATTFSAAAISGMTATAKATEGAARTPDHVVDGSGMTGLAHSNVHADNLMWHSPNTTGRWFKVDLGVSYFVDYMVIYNINWATLTSRGCKNVEVFYSNSTVDPGNPINNPGNWTAFGSAFDLTQAPGASDYGTTNAVEPDVVDFSGTTARWVSLKINSVHSGGYGGLSEILFYGEPESVTSEAYDGASGPDAGDGKVGTPNGTVVDVDLSWKTGKDPVQVEAYNLAITEHKVYMSLDQNVDPVDPNLYLVDTVAVTGLDQTTAIAMTPYGGSYLWRVDEVLPGDANEITGPVWTFESLSTVPDITDQPDDVVVDIDGTVNFAITATSLTAETYAWFKVGDPTDTPLVHDGTKIIINTNSLEITDAEAADEGYYYCVVTNDGGPETSDTAKLGVRHMMARYSMDQTDYSGGNYLDVSTEDSIDNDAVVQGVPNPIFVTGADGTENGAVLIDSNGVANAGTWNPSEFTDQLTVTFWLESDGPNNKLQGAIGKGLNFDENMHMWYVRNPSIQEINELAFFSRANVNSPKVTMEYDDQWQLVVFTFDGTTAVGYVNGLKVDEEDMALYTGTDQPIWLGSAEDPASDRLINGALDDIRIYNYALTAKDVVDLYNANPALDDTAACLDSINEAFDLVDDCKIDILDFAALAASWLDCGLYPASACN